jgi:hypothetical protein
LSVPDRCRYRRTPPPIATIDRGAVPDGRRCESQLSSVSLADAPWGSDGVEWHAEFNADNDQAPTLLSPRIFANPQHAHRKGRSLVTPHHIVMVQDSGGSLSNASSESMAADRFTTLMEI